MASQVIDLTDDDGPILPSIGDSPSKFIYAKSRVQDASIRQTSPQKKTKSARSVDPARVPTESTQPEDPEVLLMQAIDVMDKENLGVLLKKVCAENAVAKALVRSEVLVTSDKVVPYHADSASEDDVQSEEESSNDEENKEPVQKPLHRLVQCGRCPEAFYEDENDDDECVWHTGTKKINWDSDVWFDYNEGCGPEEDHVDNPAYAEGFKWTCCGDPGNSGGCQEGNHIDEKQEEEPKKESMKSLKRKAEEVDFQEKRSVYVSRYAMCENCKEQFDVTDNPKGDCLWHTDIKVVNYDSIIWADHDEGFGYEMFKDDPLYQRGFMWQCCEKSGGDPGCKETKHKALKIQERKKSRR